MFTIFFLLCCTSAYLNRLRHILFSLLYLYKYPSFPLMTTSIFSVFRRLFLSTEIPYASFSLFSFLITGVFKPSWNFPQYIVSNTRSHCFFFSPKKKYPVAGDVLQFVERLLACSKPRGQPSASVNMRSGACHPSTWKVEAEE